MEQQPVIAGRDISWLKFWLVTGVAICLIAGIRYKHNYYVNPGELIMFYIGLAATPFLFAAVLISLLHLVGKRMTTGMQSPRRKVLILGGAIAVLQTLLHLMHR